MKKIIDFILRSPFIFVRIFLAFLRKDIKQIKSYWKTFLIYAKCPFRYLLLELYLFNIKAFNRPVVVLCTWRLGHLTLNTDYFLRKMRNDPQYARKFKKCYCISETNKPNICNPYLLNKYAKHLPLIKNDFVAAFLREKNINLVQDVRSTSHFSWREVADYSPTDLSFSTKEHKEAHRFLSRYDFDSDRDWYVCIFARDPAYLKMWNPHVDTSYHDYRNFSVNDFHLAIENVLSRGGFVFRIGNNVGEELRFSHPRVIDYSKDANSFMDIYLIANCKFIAGPGSGPGGVSICYEVPQLWLNLVPAFNFFHLFKNTLFLPKKWKSTKTGEYVSYSDIFYAFPGDKNVYAGDGHKVYDKGFVYENNSPQDINEAFTEMFERLENKYKPSEKEEKLLQQYYSFLQRHTHLLGDPFKNHTKEMKLKPFQATPISLSFLKENKKLFDIAS